MPIPISLPFSGKGHWAQRLYKPLDQHTLSLLANGRTLQSTYSLESEYFKGPTIATWTSTVGFVTYTQLYNSYFVSLLVHLHLYLIKFTKQQTKRYNYMLFPGLYVKIVLQASSFQFHYLYSWRTTIYKLYYCTFLFSDEGF